MTRRRWIADEWDENSAVLRNGAAAHLARVLRARVGQTFDVVAGETVRRGRIERVDEDAVEFSLHEEIAAAASLPLVVGLSLIRFDRMEWAIEKLTELGVAQVVPVVAQRSERRLVEAAAKRAERWRRIAHAAAQQSRRADVMAVAEPMPLARWLNDTEHGPRLFCSEEEHARTLGSCLENSGDRSETISIAIGPEGGWSPMEMDRFVQHGWQSITLGPHILRSETAAIAAASVVSAWILGAGMEV